MKKPVMDILICASRDDVDHKLAENVPKHHDYAFWTVNGTPQQTGPGAAVLFTDGESVHARGEIVGVHKGEVRFEPLERVDQALPAEPVTRGFKYVD